MFVRGGDFSYFLVDSLVNLRHLICLMGLVTCNEVYRGSFGDVERRISVCVNYQFTIYHLPYHSPVVGGMLPGQFVQDIHIRYIGYTSHYSAAQRLSLDSRCGNGLSAP